MLRTSIVHLVPLILKNTHVFSHTHTDIRSFSSFFSPLFQVAGNYAADLLPNLLGKKKGYPIGLYLDSKTNTYVEEFSTSNFVAITKDNKFVTPKSPTILPSITNKVGMDVCVCICMYVCIHVYV
jgi:branched-subunit amino acid aminotransferase/4-amino-4-deoxychorismate lyase